MVSGSYVYVAGRMYPINKEKMRRQYGTNVTVMYRDALPYGDAILFEMKQKSRTQGDPRVRLLM